MHKGTQLIYGLIFHDAVGVPLRVQRDGVLYCAQRRHLSIDKFIKCTNIADICDFKSDDSVVVFAWNCISRNRAHLNRFIQYLLRNNIRIYSATSSYCIDPSVDCWQFYRAFNLYEDIRFNLLSGKSADGVRTRIANGNAPGRRSGARNIKHVWDGYEKQILGMHSRGASLYAISKKIKISAPTIKRFLMTHNTKAGNTNVK